MLRSRSKDEESIMGVPDKTNHRGRRAAAPAEAQGFGC
jgi:hypothetical protein